MEWDARQILIMPTERGHLTESYSGAGWDGVGWRRILIMPMTRQLLTGTLSGVGGNAVDWRF